MEKDIKILNESIKPESKISLSGLAPTNRPNVIDYSDRIQQYYNSLLISWNNSSFEDALSTLTNLHMLLSQVEFKKEISYPFLDLILPLLSSALTLSTNSPIYNVSLGTINLLLNKSDYYFNLIVNQNFIDNLFKTLTELTGNDTYDATRFTTLNILCKNDELLLTIYKIFPPPLLSNLYASTPTLPQLRAKVLSILLYYSTALPDTDIKLFFESIKNCFVSPNNTASCIEELFRIILSAVRRYESAIFLLSEVGLLNSIHSFYSTELNSSSLNDLIDIYAEAAYSDIFPSEVDITVFFQIAMESKSKKTTETALRFLSTLAISSKNEEIFIKFLNPMIITLILRCFDNGTYGMKHSAIILFGVICVYSEPQVLANVIDTYPQIINNLIEFLVSSDDGRIINLIIGDLGTIIAKLAPLGNYKTNFALKESGILEDIAFLERMNENDQALISEFINMINFN